MAESRRTSRAAAAKAEADAAPAAEEQQEQQQPTAAESGGEEAFPADRLISEGQAFFGQPDYVVAGALHGESGDLTIAEAEERIDNFLNTPLEDDQEA